MLEECLLARVAVSAATYAIDKPYSYRVPSGLETSLRPGQRVLVPFGRGNRRVEGMVLSLDRGAREPNVKSVHALLDREPVVDGDGLRLALWMRERYFCTVYDAVKAMLPAGLSFALKDSYRLSDGMDREQAYEAAERSEGARRILDLIAGLGGRAEVGEIRDAFGEKDPSAPLKLLRDKGILTLETSASRGVGDKLEPVVRLALPPEEALSQLAPSRGRYPLRYSVAELLAAVGEATVKEVCYFTGASAAMVKGLEKKGILTLGRQEVFRRPEFSIVEPTPPPVLNEEQETAFEGLRDLCDGEEAACALLYGVTGSGKTQVYIRLIRHVLDKGETALVLVPEIGLTPQMLKIFAGQFGDAIAVLHSSLATGERYDEWKRARRGEARVVIGTRSAIFAPLPNLGLIILDEEQEGSYKSENVPRYHARDVAKYRCAQRKALLVLGSATPAVETMYHARQGVYRLFTMKQRYNERALPQVVIADLKEELRRGNDTTLSLPLRQALRENLDRGEQSILFINRRGTSRMVTCVECGAVPECTRCSVKLTYHKANGRLMCHYCGHSQPLPNRCPQCGGPLTFVGAGTQKVEEELHTLFPGAEVLRMDTDTVTARQGHEKLLRRFEEEKIPILVGTQMVAKGLDFENVTLVGVIDADLSLYVDDFRAGERTFSLLTQVVGRAGRGTRAGRAVIQTCTPEHDVITCAARQDYDKFYESEIVYRRTQGYPPFQDLCILTASGLEEGAVLRCCMRLRDGLESWKRQPGLEDIRILGPAAAGVVKVNNRYRYRLTICCENKPAVRHMIAYLLRAAHEDKQNRGVSVFADLNPLD